MSNLLDSAMLPPVQALILADRQIPELEPILHGGCPALLPVAGKPIIELILEELQTAGVHRVFIAAAGAAKLADTLGDGSRFGLSIQYLLTRGDRPLEQLLWQISDPLRSKDLLVVSSSTLRSRALGPFLDLMADEQRPAVQGVAADGKSLGLRFLRPDRLGEHQTPSHYPSVTVSQAKARTIDGFKSLIELNLEVAENPWPGLNIPAREVEPGLRAGRLARVEPGSAVGSSIVVGHHSFVHATSRLDKVVISDHCYIDRNTQLEEVLVMPDSYVGEGLSLRRAIIDGKRWIDSETGRISHVHDSEVISELAAEQPLGLVAGAIGRLAAWLLLPVVILLMPLVVLASIGVDHRRPISHSHRMRSAKTGRSFVTFEGATSIPWLRYLPWVFAVAVGHLRWVGPRPLDPLALSELNREWEKVREHCAGGLFGPGQWAYLRGADEVECRLADSLLACDESRFGHLIWIPIFILGWLTPRLWLPTDRKRLHRLRKRPHRIQLQRAQP